MTKQLSPFAVAYRLKSDKAAQEYALQAGIPTHQARVLLRSDAEQIERLAQDATYYDGLARTPGVGRDDVRTLKAMQRDAAEQVQAALARLREWGLA